MNLFLKHRRKTTGRRCALQQRGAKRLPFLEHHPRARPLRPKLAGKPGWDSQEIPELRAIYGLRSWQRIAHAGGFRQSTDASASWAHLITSGRHCGKLGLIRRSTARMTANRNRLIVRHLLEGRANFFRSISSSRHRLLGRHTGPSASQALKAPDWNKIQACHPLHEAD